MDAPIVPATIKPESLTHAKFPNVNKNNVMPKYLLIDNFELPNLSEILRLIIMNQGVSANKIIFADIN